MKNIWAIYMFIIFIFIVAVIGIALYFYTNQFGYEISSIGADWTQFSIYFQGVVGTIFSLISFIAICVTFFIQNKDQRVQQLDSSFFSLLSIQREIIKSIEGHVNLNSGGVSKKIQGFEYIKVLAEIIQKRDVKEYYNNLDDYKTDLLKFYEESETVKNSLGYYFRHLYHIFKYVNESNVTNKIKYTYINIIQAQMSDNELYLCFINSCSKYGENRFKPLLSKYHFFENIKAHKHNFDLLKVKLYPETKFKYSSLKNSK